MSQINGRKIARADYNALAATVDGLSGIGEQIERGIAAMPQDYYEATDPDYANAVIRAVAALKENATTGYGYSYGAGKLFIPKGIYAIGQTIDLTATTIIEGEGGADASGGATVLNFPANTTGIRIQRHNTEGATSLGGNGVGGDGSIIRNLWLNGGYSGTEGEYHGVHAKARVRVENCYFYNFQGDGIAILATAGSGDSIEGNANCWMVDKAVAQGCRNGLYLNGADTNAGTSIGFNAQGCRQSGIFDSSFLSNAHIGAHAETNGIIAGSTTLCTYSGKRYYVLDPDLASTTAPSGTTASNAAWA